MKGNLIFSFFLFSFLGSAQSYPPDFGQEGSTAIPHTSSVFVGWATGIQVVRGPINITDLSVTYQGSNMATSGNPSNALGIAGGASVSLGDGGSAVLTFAWPIANGQGADFAVFENGFKELAFVEVSSDGINFFRFPSHSQTQTHTQVGTFGLVESQYLHNLAGKYGSRGTPFDLDEIPDDTLLNKNRITHVKVIDVIGTIHPDYASYDSYGNIVNDPFPTPFDSCGFDLTGIGVIHENRTMSKDRFSDENIIIYPNPADKVLNINLNLNDEIVFYIYDISGRLIFSQQHNSGVAAINVSGLNSGIYFLQILKEGDRSNIITKRFIKR